jgi:phage gpG-like protein
VRVEVQGDGGAIHRLGVYADHIEDWYDFWPEVADAFAQREEIWFGRNGEGWEKLSDEYGARKAKKHPGKGILVASGSLKDSFTDPDEVLIHRTSEQAWFGSTHWLAKIHAKGNEDNNLPARPPLIPVQRLAAAIGRLLDAWVDYEKHGGGYRGGRG